MKVIIVGWQIAPRRRAEDERAGLAGRWMKRKPTICLLPSRSLLSLRHSRFA